MKNDIEKKIEPIKRYSFHLFPGYLGLQVILFLVQYLFKVNMPWYIMWFPSLIIAGILAIVIAIVVVGAIAVGDFFLCMWLVGEYDKKGIFISVILNVLLIAVIVLLII